MDLRQIKGTKRPTLSSFLVHLKEAQRSLMIWLLEAPISTFVYLCVHYTCMHKIINILLLYKLKNFKQRFEKINTENLPPKPPKKFFFHEYFTFHYS